VEGVSDGSPSRSGQLPPCAQAGPLNRFLLPAGRDQPGLTYTNPCLPQAAAGTAPAQGHIFSWELVEHPRPYPPSSPVRNSFKISGCHKTDDATQKSTGKAKFTSAEGCTPGGLGGVHRGREVHKSFIRCHAVPPPLLDWAGLGLTVYMVG
jgi:hypothetical protein